MAVGSKQNFTLKCAVSADQFTTPDIVVKETTTIINMTGMKSLSFCPVLLQVTVLLFPIYKFQ